MCGCTLYDSPTCGHSWLSMSQPCGFLSDLLSCPYRQTYQTLIAPAYTCPMCNGGFADRETIEMVQGPWGCNQMIRNHVGGNYAVPGQWGNAPLISGGWGGPAITSGPSAVIPMNHMNHGFTYDHRLTGPYCPQSMASQAPMMTNGAMMTSPAMVANGPMVASPQMICDDGYSGFDEGYNWDYDNRRKRRRHKSYHKYKYTNTNKPATNCTVM